MFFCIKQVVYKLFIIIFAINMAKETLYPSQINTKTISCRISSADYVNFLNDALSKGITLNDWLLMKIYNQNQNINGLMGNQQTSGDGDTLKFPFTLDINSEIYTFTDLEDIESFIINSTSKISHLLEFRDNYKQKIAELTENLKFSAMNIDLSKKSDRAVIFNKFIEIINQTEWESLQDKKKIKRDLTSIFNDLFE